ncbi:MAG: right-handed parallel beta-helix repeat-containing protein [Moraxella sp.]|nr:right-handed parallel beta-helix repeat-containing protein [Moraxella sp.]
MDFFNEPQVTITITSTDNGNLDTQKDFTLSVMSSSQASFIETHISKEDKFAVVANLSVAKTKAIEDSTLTHIIISDGNHHALLQKNVDGIDIGINGWTATFEHSVPVVAFYEGDLDISYSANQALSVAKMLNLGVDFPKHRSFMLYQPLLIENGVQYLHGHGTLLTVEMFDTGSNVNPQGAIMITKKTSQLEIDGLVLDMKNSKGAEGILGFDAQDITITNNTIVNVSGTDNNAGAGIAFYNGNDHVRYIYIENNRIQALKGDSRNTHEVNGITLIGATTPAHTKYNNSNGDRIWQEYIDNEGNIQGVDPNRTMSHIEITGNQIDGGYYGINLMAVTNSNIIGNHITNNVRNISMQNNTTHNLVRDNLLTDALSSAVHIAYNSDSNTIHRNTVSSTRASGQALLQAYQGSENNLFNGNHVEVLPNSETIATNTAGRLLYTASNDGGNHFISNMASGRVAVATFAAESIWDYASASDELSAYAHNMQDGRVFNGFISHGGGFGNMNDVVFNNNILAPNITQRPTTAPIIYLGADTSTGQNLDPHLSSPAGADKNIIGNITNMSINGNILLTNSNIKELIYEHENGATVEWQGDGILYDSDGIYQNSIGTVYSIIDYHLSGSENALYLMGDNHINGYGNSSDNILTGNGRMNILEGKAGNDILNGGYGADVLYGGDGADTFVFKSKIDGINIDDILDFSASQGDKIGLSSLVFGYLSGDWFSSDDSQISYETRVIQKDNALYLDLDGAGDLYYPIQFATINTILTQDDFIINQIL